MDIRKNDTERAINLLKIYKSKLNKTDDKSLRRVMENLIELLESELYNALMDIHDLYEDTLISANLVNKQPIEQIKEIVKEKQQIQPSTSKADRDKKSMRHQKSEEVSYETETRKINEVLPVSSTSQRYQYEEPDFSLPQDLPPDPSEFEEDNRWDYFEIQLNKGKKGYGFGVDGGFDKNHFENDSSIYITKIVPGGAADVDGRLRVDDALMSVNDTNLEYVLHDTAVEILKGAGKSMTLIIRRLKELASDQGMTNLEEHADTSLNLYSLPPDNNVSDQEHLDQLQIQEFEIILTKKPGAGLGFSVNGGYDIDDPESDSFVYISRITPGGVANVDGQLQVNDVLLMVDDKSLNGLSHDEVVSLLKNTGRSVKLFIGRFLEEIPEEPVVIKQEKKKKKHRRDRSDN